MKTPIRVLIVDDEPRARRGMQLLLAAFPDFTIAGEAGDGEDALLKIRALRPDLVLLDVQMPGLGGFEVLTQLSKAEMPVVVFVTAFDHYAIKAFEAHALDYLLKPVEDDRFAQAMARVREQLANRQAGTVHAQLAEVLEALRLRNTDAATGGAPGMHAAAGGVPVAGEPAAAAHERTQRVAIKNGTEIVLLRADEIDWIEADGDYMQFHVGGKVHLHRETMANLEARLDPARFRRVHRSTMVNLDRVARLTPSSNGEHTVVLRDGTKLRLSKGYQDRLQEWFREAL